MGGPKKKPAAPAAPASNDDSFAISEEVFNAIPKTTRGRISCANLNAMWSAIYDAYMGQPPNEREPVPPAAISKNLTAAGPAGRGMSASSGKGKSAVNCLRN